MTERCITMSLLIETYGYRDGQHEFRLGELKLSMQKYRLSPFPKPSKDIHIFAHPFSSLGSSTLDFYLVIRLHAPSDCWTWYAILEIK